VNTDAVVVLPNPNPPSTEYPRTHNVPLVFTIATTSVAPDTLDTDVATTVPVDPEFGGLGQTYKEPDTNTPIVIEFDALDALLVPIPFVAVTVNVYAVALVNPLTVIDPEPA
jgi:hypothetical protein